MSKKILSIGAWGLFDHLYMMNNYPKEGETVELNMGDDEFHKVYYGDCSINIAYIVSSLGYSSSLATVVGDDFISSGYAKYLKDNNVDISNVDIVKGIPSGHNLIFFDKKGDGFCFSHLGAAKEQSKHKVSKSAIDDSAIVVISEMFSSYTLEAIQYARKMGRETVINGMVGTALQKATEFLKCTNTLFINKSEYKELLGVLNIQNEKDIFNLGIKKIFLTKGKRGGTILTASSAQDFSIVPSKVVKDTTGAGDSFVAGTVVALAKGYSDIEAARIGATVSSYIVEEWGCQTNSPTWEQVMERYGKFILQEGK